MTRELQHHFLAMVADLCEQARLGQVPVEIALTEGKIVSGVPNPRPVGATDPRAIDDTGYEDVLRIDEVEVSLSDVAEVRVRRPA
jgi:hypothetical protein